MKKILLIITLCITLLLACGFQAKALEAARAQFTQYGGYGPFGGVQTDDPAVMKRLGEIVSAVLKREPLASVPDAAYSSVHVTLDLEPVLRKLAFVREGRYMETDGVRYPCTESEFSEIVKMAESAPAQKDLVYWVLRDEKGEVAAEKFSMTEGAAETLAKMAEEAPPVENFDEFPSESVERLSVSFYSGDRLEYFIFSPQWLRRDSDGILYQRTTPAQYQAVRELLGAGSLTFEYPKTLTVLKAFVWGEPVRITDAEQIRGILEPLQGSGPCNVEGGACPMGIDKLTLDGKAYLNVDGQVIYFSGDGNYYRMNEDYSDWLKTLPTPAATKSKV